MARACRHLKILLGTMGIVAVVDVADLETEPYVNLLCHTTVEELKARARSGFWDGGHGGPPCSTFSPALSKPLPGGGGPRPYRSRQFLFGLPELEGRRLERVQHANRLLQTSMDVLGEISASGGSASQEHPRDPGAPHPSSWKMPHVAAWEEEHGMVLRDLDQCQYGAASKKPTTITWKVKGAEKVMHELEK